MIGRSYDASWEGGRSSRDIFSPKILTLLLLDSTAHHPECGYRTND
jgi:hypothetical protein